MSKLSRQANTKLGAGLKTRLQTLETSLEGMTALLEAWAAEEGNTGVEVKIDPQNAKIFLAKDPLYQALKAWVTR